MTKVSSKNISSEQYFITATDTDAGKTYFAQILVKAFTLRNKAVAVYKPISAGCDEVNGELINGDAKALVEVANVGQTIRQVNPIAFKEAIAPHIAANKHNAKITLADINTGFDALAKHQADITITEGAGGWRLPLGNNVFLSQFVQHQQLKVILVVNMKLGCLNHAILTYESIKADGLTCVGWVANCQQPMEYLAENLSELKAMIAAPCLGVLNYQPDINQAVDNIDLSVLA